MASIIKTPRPPREFLLLFPWLIISMTGVSTASGGVVSPPGVKAVNIGAWLVIEGWMTPELFHGVPKNALMDGTKISLQSVTNKMYLSAVNGGGSTVAADKSNPQDWETFRLWKMENSDREYKIRVNNDQFISINDGGELVATVASSGQAAVFQIISSTNNEGLIRIKAPSSVTANGKPDGSWSNSDPSVFNIIVDDKQMQGDSQLCSFHGAEKTVSILQDHWNTYIVEDDFSFISSHGLNAVRIPIAWWITKQNDTPSCHPPNYPGYQAVLDKAFDWADKYNLGVIVDLHAAPGSQNGFEHSASRDGNVGWDTDENINHTVQVIEAIAARYASRKSLLAIELLNEPAQEVKFAALKKYYSAGYDAVNRQVKRDDVYVIMSARLMPDGPTEIIEFASGLKKCALDVHYYNLYESKFQTMNADQNINFVKGDRASQLKNLIRENGPLVFVGEWSAAWHVPDASDENCKRFADAQMGVYGQASFGWSYWSYKNIDRNWSLKDMINANIISVPKN
uniref:Uncharacterized protein n=1 Tax=Leersia perrieri TaxID=77586 RepID=A0A0D9XJ30_9ORYZ